MLVRYIKDYLEGPSGNHWIEIEAYSNSVNVALEKPVTHAGSVYAGSPSNVTDGNMSVLFETTGAPLSWVQIDLGSSIEISEIKVWHYYQDGRIYNGTKTEVSEDGVNWTTVFDSAVSGTYAESAEGHVITLSAPVESILPWDEFLGKMNLNTGFFETSQYVLDKQMRVIAGNWDGAGMSAGNLQYNWGTADRLSELFNYMFANHENVVSTAFGADTARFQEFKTVNTTYTRAQKIAWGATITDPNNGHKIIEPWLTLIGNLLVTPECYAKYVQMMDVYYLQNALFVFRQMSCTSRMALASFFDITINKGRYYPINLLQIDFERIDDDTTLTEAEKEAKKIYQINIRGNEEENGLNDASSTTFWPRRGCMANMGGDYYGSPYDPESQFDMTLEPAIAEKSTTPVSALNVKLGDIQVNDIFLGNQKISSLYLGAILLSSAVPTEPFTTTKVPQTQFRTNPNSYAGIGAVSTLTLDQDQPLWVDVQNYVACKTHFTIDGTTPTTASPTLGDGPFKFTESCTLKTLSVSVNGIAESVKTLTVTVNPPVSQTPQFWRYIRFIGHGDNTGATTRLVELQAMHGAVNRLLNVLPMAGYATPNAGAIAVATDGAFLQASGYPLWWSGEGIPDLKYDIGDWYAIDTIKVAGYSKTTDPRQTQFIIQISADNATWYTVADYSNNTTAQPEAGFAFAVAFA